MNGRLAIMAIVGAFLLGVAGISHADGWMHKSGSSAGNERATMERSTGMQVPSSDSWQYFEATETGNFPAQAESSREPARSGPPVLWDRPQATTTIGGQEFRDVDLGP